MRPAKHGPPRTYHLARLGGVLAFAIIVAACDATPELDPPPPLVVDDPADSVPPIEPSVIESEVRYDLDPALAALEKAVPTTFGDITRRLDVPTNRRLHLAFAASRTPFEISVAGTTVAVTSVIQYEGRGWYRPPIGPEISSACGTGTDVAKPRARVRIISRLSLTSQWSLVSRSRIDTVAPFSLDERDRCRVTIFRVDVTDRVMKATQDVLLRQLAALDSNITRVQTRGRFERWWRDMSRPIRLADSVWFTINPQDVQLVGIQNDAGTLVAGLRLTARPRIETGNRPNDFDLFRPLPPLARGSRKGGGLTVMLDGELDYAVATNMLRRALVGRDITMGQRTLSIRSVDLMGIGAGRVALGVHFSGAFGGLMYLIGTPQYDAKADQLLVPDLAYDLRTSDALVRSLSWLKDDAIRDFLRQRARFPVTGQLDRLRDLAQRGMNRDLTQGVRLVANLARAEAVGVRALRSGLRVRAVATGSAHLEIDKPVVIRGKGGQGGRGTVK